MNRRTLLRRMAAASGGIAAASGAVTATDGVDLESVDVGDEVVVAGRRVEVIEAAGDGGPRFVDVSESGQELCCCDEPTNRPCSVLCPIDTECH